MSILISHGCLVSGNVSTKFVGGFGSVSGHSRLRIVAEIGRGYNLASQKVGPAIICVNVSYLNGWLQEGMP